MISLNDYIINEGLIYSYDPCKVINLINKKFNASLRNDDVFLDDGDIDEYIEIEHNKNDKIQFNIIGILDSTDFQKNKK